MNTPGGACHVTSAELAATSCAWVRGVLDAKEIGMLTKLLGKLAEAGDASTA